MRKCLKCGFVSRAIPDPLACPECGAVYAKVEAAASAGLPVRPSTGRPSQLQDNTRPAVLPSLAKDEPFIARLRRESVYPTFRAVVRIGYWIVMLLALVVLIGAFRTSSTYATMIGIGIALLLAVGVSFAREATLMLADLSDAAVRMAERQESRDGS